MELSDAANLNVNNLTTNNVNVFYPMISYDWARRAMIQMYQTRSMEAFRHAISVHQILFFKSRSANDVGSRLMVADLSKS